MGFWDWVAWIAMGWIAASLIVGLMLGAVVRERDRHPY